MFLSRREFLKIMSAASIAGMLPNNSNSMSGFKVKRFAEISEDMYQIPMKGNVRLLHITDTHAQLNPIHLREPNINLGVGSSYNKLPHLVGTHFLKKLRIEPDSPLAHAFTYLNFYDAAEQLGKVGGAPHLKTLLDILRVQAGGQENTLTIDGGNSWQGSGLSLFTRGKNMVNMSNLLGIDIMTGNKEFTYNEEEVLSNISQLNGTFLSHNTRIKESFLFDSNYYSMIDKYDDIGLHSKYDALAFKPYEIKIINNERIAILGQSFHNMKSVNPRANFLDWEFGLYEKKLQKTIDYIREHESVSVVVVLSNNGMDVDLKMASRINGIDALLGGGSMDVTPKSIKIKAPNGKVCHVTNAGSHSKFVGCMDLDIQNGKLRDVNYKLIPVFSNALRPDTNIFNQIHDVYSQKYDNNVIESRNHNIALNKKRMGLTYGEILSENLSITDDFLYRNDSFMGTWDQILVNSLKEEFDAQIAFSPGFKWGNSLLPGEMITMEDVMNQTSLTYGETHSSYVKGSQIKDILEKSCEDVFQNNPYLRTGEDVVRVGGMDYFCEPNAPFGKRISGMQLDNGTPIVANKEYSMAGWANPNQIGNGRLMWDVASDYLKKNRKNPKLKKINTPKLKGIKGNKGVENYF